MSLAAAICSMFSVGIVPMRFYFPLVAAGGRWQVRRAGVRFHPNVQMKLFPFALCLLTLSFVAPVAHARDEIHKGDVVVVPLQGEVSPPMFAFLRRVQKAAESAGASAIIFEM